MTQFDVYCYAPRGMGFAFVIDVQNKILENLVSRVVIPLYKLNPSDQPMLRLNPIVQFSGDKYYLATEEMGAVSAKALNKSVASLAEHRDEIIAAIDFLTTGV
jgi:toxin CcdB